MVAPADRSFIRYLSGNLFAEPLHPMAGYHRDINQEELEYLLSTLIFKASNTHNQATET